MVTRNESIVHEKHEPAFGLADFELQLVDGRIDRLIQKLDYVDELGWRGRRSAHFVRDLIIRFTNSCLFKTIGI